MSGANEHVHGGRGRGDGAGGARVEMLRRATGVRARGARRQGARRGHVLQVDRRKGCLNVRLTLHGKKGRTLCGGGGHCCWWCWREFRVRLSLRDQHSHYVIFSLPPSPVTDDLTLLAHYPNTLPNKFNADVDACPDSPTALHLIQQISAVSVDAQL